MRFLAALLACLTFSAHATTPTTDFSDLWFNPNEEGNYSGSYFQNGRMGSISGAGSCTDGVAQSFTASEVQGGIQGLSMRYRVLFSGACTAEGRMGGVRRGP